MSFYDLFSDLCKNKGVKPSRAATDLGINRSNVTNWKNGGYTPRGAVLQQIADYFGVSIDYLLGREDEYGLTPGDWEIMGALYHAERENAGITTAYIAENAGLTEKAVVDFESGVAPVPVESLAILCGLIGRDPTVVFQPFADRLYGIKKEPAAGEGNGLDERYALFMSLPPEKQKQALDYMEYLARKEETEK